MSEGLEPFAALDCGQFSAFCDKPQESLIGAVAVTVPGQPRRGEGANKPPRRRFTGRQDLWGGRPRCSEVRPRETRHDRSWKKARRRSLERLAVNVALKADNKGFQAALKKAESRALADRLRTVLTGISDEASLMRLRRKRNCKQSLDL